MIETATHTLAIECSSIQGSACIALGKTVLASVQWTRQGSKGEWLTPAIETCFKFSGIGPKDLNYIAVGVGPGSFTGIRIAIGSAKALAYSAKIPLVCESSLKLLAEAACAETKEPNILSLVNSYDNRVFAQSFRSTSKGLQEVNEPASLDAEGLILSVKKKVLCVGDGWEVIEAKLKSGEKKKFLRDPKISDFPQARTLILCAQNSVKESKTFVWNQIEPLYLRASSAEEKMRKGNVIPF